MDLARESVVARRLQAAKLKGACVESIDSGPSRGLDKGVIGPWRKLGIGNQSLTYRALGLAELRPSFAAGALADKTTCRKVTRQSL